MAPAQAGRSVSAATRVAVPGFSSSTSSSTSRLPSRLIFATVTRRRATRTAGPAELVSKTYRAWSGRRHDGFRKVRDAGVSTAHDVHRGGVGTADREGVAALRVGA